MRCNDGAEIWRAKMDGAVADFMSRTDSDDVFKARLYGLGFRGARLQEEFNYHYGLRASREKVTA